MKQPLHQAPPQPPFLLFLRLVPSHTIPCGARAPARRAQRRRAAPAGGRPHARPPIARRVSRSASPITPTSAAARIAAATSAAQICTVCP